VCKLIKRVVVDVKAQLASLLGDEKDRRPG